MRQVCSRSAGGAPWDFARGTSGTELAAAVVAARGAVEQRSVERVVPRGGHLNGVTNSGGVSTPSGLRSEVFGIAVSSLVDGRMRVAPVCWDAMPLRPPGLVA